MATADEINELGVTPATTLAARIHAKQLSPVELMESTLRSIELTGPQLNSVVAFQADRALATAREAESRIGDEDAPRFLGVPMLIKDTSLVAGLRTTLGTPTFARFVPTFDDENVSRLRRAGFVIVGKTNVSELGSAPHTESEFLGPCRNPWDLQRSPGGSSGGAAAAVAAGIVPLAHGSEGDGSIRIPASCCGVFGLKPSRGRISNAPLYGDHPVGLSTTGPLSRFVIDAAAYLDVVHGYATGDPHWAPPPPRPFEELAGWDPGRLRVGVFNGPRFVRWSQASRDALDRTVALLGDLGHEVDEVTLPVDESLSREFARIWSAGIAASPVDHSTLEPFNQWLAERGRNESAPRLIQGLTALQLQARSVVGTCLPYDAVIFPTLTREPFRLGELAELDPPDAFAAGAEFAGITPLANITGQPAASLPLHWSPDGLPIGVTLLGRPATEGTLLQLARQLEEASGWPNQRPPLL